MKVSRSSLLLLLLSTTQLTLGQDEFPCFSLSGSQTCPAFQDYYISTVGRNNVLRFPFLTNVTNIQTFDTAMKNFVVSPSFNMMYMGCKASASNTIPYARYSLTYVCSMLIQDNTYSLPCNYDKGLSPPPLCQASCFDWITSLDQITSNTDVCPNPALQQQYMDAQNSTCQSWSGLNGTTSSCIKGQYNEPNDCGYLDTASACTYCKSNGGDTCCQSVKCNALSGGGIAGIIIGILIAIALAVAYYFFCYRKNKRSKNGVSYSNNGFVMNSKVETQHDSSSALGYDSLASQGALLHQPKESHNKPHNLSIQNLHSTPPPPATLPMQNAHTMEEFYEVKHPYPPQMGDELGLHVGDIVCVAMNFDDGWALGFNVTTGLKGVFPVVCVTPAPEELLEQLLYEQPSNKTFVDDGGMNMQQICENLRRSMSASSKRTINTLPTSVMTQHSNIPRRTASMMRSNYEYRESDSPTSPTLHTPFFDVGLSQQQQQQNNSTLSQPEPALFQPVETYEMHRKNNRVSKLEEPI